MAQPPTIAVDELGIALANLRDAASGTVTPTLRLGVTGLSRAGKTIFITALIHNLLTGARLPGFTPAADGRLVGAEIAQYPDKAMPRFAYEQHLAALTGHQPVWPDSTRRISQLRVTLKYQSTRFLKSLGGLSTLHLDIVDYPGEWLLDLPLLSLSFAEWSADALERARRPASTREAEAFLAALDALDPLRAATDTGAELLANGFTQYLRLSREDGRALSSLPPGRFLMPGDLEGTPALTFAPLPAQTQQVRRGTLYALMEERYEAYKRIVVRPFFRNHFARLDRQIVLVDALRALNAGPEAVADLETALTGILACYRQGDGNPWTRLVSRRIDRILFAATKADHVHHTSHDRLEAILKRIVADASRRAKFAGAETRSLALASVRATTEGTLEEAGETLPCIIGKPLAGETIGGKIYDGVEEIALFPGDLPANPDTVLEPGNPVRINFLRFTPPDVTTRTSDGVAVLPHIRLDRALEYLIGDWLR
ncbi:MAG: Amino acid regulated cytosolic protein [Devosia sp.]|nr:Amino acid regulated cytosolic protein [Devosia sp.]